MIRRAGVAVSFVSDGCRKPGVAKELQLRLFYFLNSKHIR